MIAALRARWFRPRPLLSWRRRRIDIPAVLIVIGALLLAAFLGEVERSAAEDLDVVAALSGLQNQQTAYETALQAYASVQRLSLFDYIR